jgi:L-fuconolactonase
VQAAPTEAETRWLLDLARRTPSVAGVVGWLDFDAPDAADRVSTLAADALLVGLRPMIQDLADDDWMLRSHLDVSLTAMARHRLVFDALVKPRHLARLAALADRHQNLRIVLDHGGKPDPDAAGLAPWRAAIAALAQRENVAVKLSGLVTEIGAGWRPADVEPAMAHLLASFGARRVLFGSDWPVLNLAADYATWLTLAEGAVTQTLGAAALPDVMGGNAAAVYLNGRGAI